MKEVAPGRRMPPVVLFGAHVRRQRLGAKARKGTVGGIKARVHRISLSPFPCCLPLHVPGASRPYFLVFGRIVSRRRVCDGSLPARTDAESEGAIAFCQQQTYSSI